MKERNIIEWLRLEIWKFWSVGRGKPRVGDILSADRRQNKLIYCWNSQNKKTNTGTPV